MKLHRCRLLMVAALATAPLTGCGVADYEKKMMDAEARVQRFDEDNKLLGVPLAFPSEPAQPMEVFLRPPKGVVKTPDPAKDQPPFRFAASASVMTELLVIFGGADDDKAKLEKQIEDRLGRTAQTWQAVEIHPPERTQPTTFDAVEFNDPMAPANAPAVFLAYVHQGAGHPPVAVVFHLLQANRTGAEPVVKRCLETYAEAGEAVKARLAFAARSAR